MFEELSFQDTIAHLEAVEDEDKIQVPVHSIKMYEVIQDVARKDHEAQDSGEEGSSCCYSTSKG